LIRLVRRIPSLAWGVHPTGMGETDVEAMALFPSAYRHSLMGTCPVVPYLLYPYTYSRLVMGWVRRYSPVREYSGRHLAVR
jgi:hypothetical protein